MRAYGAKVIDRQDNPRLYGIVKKIADLNGLPTPRIAIVPSSTPNAFATGRNPQNAVVAATTGIMSILDDHELEGVMAHELAHVKNRDTLVMCVAAVIAGFISFAARMMMWNSMFGGRNRNGTSCTNHFSSNYSTIGSVFAPNGSFTIKRISC